MSCDAHQRAAACLCVWSIGNGASFIILQMEYFLFRCDTKGTSRKSTQEKRVIQIVSPFFLFLFFARMANKQKESFPRVGVNKLSKLASDKRERRELKVTDVAVTNTK